MKAVNNRELLLLRVVEEIGVGDARSIDLVMSARYGPSQSTVRSELIELADAGLLQVDEERGVGGTWFLTALSHGLLEGDHQDPGPL